MVKPNKKKLILQEQTISNKTEWYVKTIKYKLLHSFVLTQQVCHYIPYYIPQNVQK